MALFKSAITLDVASRSYGTVPTMLILTALLDTFCIQLASIDEVSGSMADIVSWLSTLISIMLLFGGPLGSPDAFTPCRWIRPPRDGWLQYYLMACHLYALAAGFTGCSFFLTS